MGYLDFYRDMGHSIIGGASAVIKETNKVAGVINAGVFGTNPPNNNPSTRGKQMKTHK